MPKLPVISCVYDYSRGNEITNTISYFSHFSDVIFSQKKHSTRGIAFISLDGKDFNYVMAYKKSGRVATKIDRLTFNKPIVVNPPISLESIEHNLPAKLKRHFQNQTSIGISAFSPKVYQSFLDYIKSSHPNVASSVEKLQGELKGIKTKHQGRSAEIAAHEKDAISLALRISGFTDNDIPKWSQDDESAPFLKGYDDIVLREDPMVVHDSQVFGDWEKISQFVVGAAEFVKDEHKLTIMNVNRHKIEETLGVDLLMYHHTYKSYVLIQYKRMTKNGDYLAYRFTDYSYSSEIHGMEQFQKGILKSNLESVNDFRLNDEFFYFKLCPAKIKEPLSTKMIPGMYLPLAYWKVLLCSIETLGKRGGRLIGYNNIGRYIDNTLFTELAQNGWIGSQVSNTELITQQIQKSITGNKSVILANYTRNGSST